MHKSRNHSVMDRRNLIKILGLGSVSGIMGMVGGVSSSNAAPRKKSPDLSGPATVKIKNVKAIGTAPQGSNLVVVKVETSEPGLYGIGCATFTQRAEDVVAEINNYMSDFCIGKD